MLEQDERQHDDIVKGHRLLWRFDFFHRVHLRIAKKPPQPRAGAQSCSYIECLDDDVHLVDDHARHELDMARDLLLRLLQERRDVVAVRQHDVAGDAQSLIQAMTRFMETTPEKRAQMGIAARKKMEREFDRQCIIDAYMDKIGEILS